MGVLISMWFPISIAGSESFAGEARVPERQF